MPHTKKSLLHIIFATSPIWTSRGYLSYSHTLNFCFDKIYLNNPNLNFSYCKDAYIGTVRETIFATFLKTGYSLSIPPKGDFLVDDRYLFEVGGKNKGFKQIANISNSFLALDDIEIGFGAKVPLWLFGFLY